MQILLLTKIDKFGVAEIIDYLQTKSEKVEIHQGTRKDPFPSNISLSHPDILISYLSPWIIPINLLERTNKWNLNFHPGPPNYPGVGCYNFALYNEEKDYGVTVHLMDKIVDSGKIIGVKRFSILPSDTLYNLVLKSYVFLLTLFFETMDYIFKYDSLPKCNEEWTRKAYTRKELEELCKIIPNMSKQEVEKRIKATKFPGMPGAFMELYGYKFEYNEKR